MTTQGTMRRPTAITLATLLVGAALSLLISAITHPAAAREFEVLVVTRDKPTFAKFDAIPESLAYPQKPDPDFCRDAAYCDTIPVRVPIPDISSGADYKLVLKADNTDGADLDFYLWDNKQFKAKYGKSQPGDADYDPLESDYTDLIVITDPQTGGPTSDGFYKLGRPDLVDYNITVLNAGGVSEGYSIYMELEVEEYTPPSETGPPDNNSVSQPSPAATADFGPPATTPEVSEPVIGKPTDLPTLNDLLIESDPDLQSIQEQNLADELAAPPTPISQLGRTDTGPPPPVSALTLLLWLAVVPAGLAGGASALVQRRRVHIPDLG